ncbi:MAG: hypothetical protein ABSG76_09170, partial [Xanthobacteraceae bacterium]
RQLTTLATAEIQASKDLLRAEFALAVCRAEQRAEMLEIKMTSLLAELGRKSDVINRVRIQLGQTIGNTINDTGSVSLVPERIANDPRRVAPTPARDAAPLRRNIVNRTVGRLFLDSWAAPPTPARRRLEVGLDPAAAIADGGPGSADRDRAAVAAADHRNRIEPRDVRTARLEVIEVEDALEQILAIARN